MTKRLFILISVVLAFLFITNVNFAANVVDDAVNEVTQDTKNAVNSIGGAVNESVSDAAHNAENMLSGATHDATTNVTNRTATTHNNYAATRTSAPFMGTTAGNVITWTVLGIAAVVIISLIWYYSSQNVHRED